MNKQQFLKSLSSLLSLEIAVLGLGTPDHWCDVICRVTKNPCKLAESFTWAVMINQGSNMVKKKKKKNQIEHPPDGVMWSLLSLSRLHSGPPRDPLGDSGIQLRTILLLHSEEPSALADGTWGLDDFEIIKFIRFLQEKVSFTYPQ